uniref:Acyl-CoA dehydrogenase family member 11 n=1 Tax=Scleropages formosus TaxID=113540 RepID=A0A8C9TRW3_SCLFO
IKVVVKMEDEITPVREQHKFNVANLQRYLSGKIRAISQEDEFTVQQRGQSNPTFLLRNHRGSWVLRKKPPGDLLLRAHQVDREFRVQEALFRIGFPVPEPLLYCTDVSVIGTEFYIMEHVQGRIFRDLRLPGASATERAALYVAAIEVLAKLHRVDVTAVGLDGFGKGPGYCRRQVSTWTKQYKATAHRDIPAVDRLSDWLTNNLPADDTETTLVHGDFRVDNLIFHPTEARVLAVLDWELSTAGQPVADLAYFLLPFYWPGTFSASSPHEPPAPDDLLAIYCRCRRIPPVVPRWNFFLALSAFKLAGIAQGIYARHLLGNASAPDAHKFGDSVEPLAEVGLQGRFLGDSVKPGGSRPPAADPRLFQQTPKGREMLQKVREFMRLHVFPAEQVSVCREPASTLRGAKARAAGLWNLFLPAVSGLSQLDYAHIAEETGRCFFAPELFNCQAPDTGNMEVLHMFGSEEQKRRWLEPLLRGEIRSCFCMTEPDVASSDATNMECSLRKDGDQYVINGKKWWSSGAGSPHCKVAIVMCRNKSHDPTHREHSMVLVPMDTAGVELIRPLTVFGEDDAIHGGHFEIRFDDVRVPLSNIILGEGRGFEIAQGRLGPGRLHHCMRAVGLAERALELLCQRAAERRTFGKKLYQHEVIAHWIAECRIAIEETRLLTLQAARCLDVGGGKAARKQIAMMKVAAGRMACEVVDRAIQVHGAAGVSDDVPLARMYAYVRTLRIADGPDEVHLSSIAGMELRDQLRRVSARL